MSFIEVLDFGQRAKKIGCLLLGSMPEESNQTNPE
jgi:hypothetical protein